MQAYSLDLGDAEDDVLVKLAVHRQLARLPELSIAVREVTLERLLAGVDVGMFLEILGQSKAFEAENAHMFLAVVGG